MKVLDWNGYWRSMILRSFDWTGGSGSIDCSNLILPACCYNDVFSEEESFPSSKSTMVRWDTSGLSPETWQP